MREIPTHSFRNPIITNFIIWLKIAMIICLISSGLMWIKMQIKTYILRWNFVFLHDF